MNKNVETRRLYHFERIMGEDPTIRLWENRPMADLQRLTDRVWGAERQPRGRPHVRAGRGVPSTGGLLSYYLWDENEIVLSRNQRNKGTLLHELTHALTDWRALDHGPAFRRSYFRLLAEHGGMDPAYLVCVAHGTGLLR